MPAEIDAAELRNIASRLLMLAEQQAYPDQPENREDEGGLFDDDYLARLAREEHELRRSRQCFLDGDLFGEAAWDILLELFSARIDRREIRVSQCCAAAGVPRSTALRYLDELQDRGLVLKHGSETEDKACCVSLTYLGFTRLRQTLRHHAATRLRRQKGEKTQAATILSIVR